MTSQEYSIRVPKNGKKKYQVMRFNNSVNVEFSKWNQVKMERENNMKEFKGTEEEQPKFGAGSEFGRDAREEARRKKYGIVSKKYRAEDQPWLLKVGGKTGKKYKGIREGGVAENASYYVFTHAADGAIEAFPLQEWYNFQPIQCYKALTAEEAEQEFGRRNKLMNYFSLMMRKRLRGDEDGEIDETDDIKLKKGGNKKKEFKISEMDDWVSSEDDSSSNSDEDKEKKDPDDPDTKKKKKGKDLAKKKKNKKRRASDSEAGEESDDGDEEGREMDYISDSSASDSDKELKGVAEEDALRKLLSSGEEDEDEEKQQEDKKEKDSDAEEPKAKDGENNDNRDNNGSKDGNKSSNSNKKKKKTKKKSGDKKKKDEPAAAADSSSDWSSDSDGPSGTTASRSATPTHGIANEKNDNAINDRKRTIQAVVASANESPPAKQSRFEPLPAECGITEDAVRRYLARKPMTTTELLQKFKSKKTGLSSDQLVNTMTLILKRINPTRQTIKGKMYLSIGSDKRSIISQASASSNATSEGSSGGSDMQL